MARSAHKLCAAHKLALLLYCAATIISAVAGDVVSYIIPAFNATTTDNLTVVSNSAIPSNSFIFGPHADPKYNSSEGFLLLNPAVKFWRSGNFEASFNTSFMLVPGAASISFVVLKQVVMNEPVTLRGGPVPASNNGSLAWVQVDAVRSYGPKVPTDSVNATVKSHAGGSCAVWVEYRAAVHNLSVYVAGAGEPKPSQAILHAPLNLFVGPSATDGRPVVGFFAAMLRDVITGIRDWNLTVDKFPERSVAKQNKATPWLVVLLAVLGSVAATSII